MNLQELDNQPLIRSLYITGYLSIGASFFFPYFVNGSVELYRVSPSLPVMYHILSALVIVGIPVLTYKIRVINNYKIQDVAVISFLTIVLLAERIWISALLDVEGPVISLGLFLFHAGIFIVWAGLLYSHKVRAQVGCKSF